MQIEEPSAAEWGEQARLAKDEGWVLADLCGLDRIGLGYHDGRFAVVVQLLNMRAKKRRTIYVTAAGDPPTVPSITPLWSGADFMEREAYDMFGIHFDGHPNLTRIMMPDEWEGHPLRKDYGVGKIPIDFLPQPFLQIDGPGQAPGTEEAGRSVDELGQMQEPRR